MIDPAISRAIQLAIVEGRLDESRTLIRKGLSASCDFELVPNNHESRRKPVLVWHILDASSAIIGLPDSAFALGGTARRIVNMLPLLAAYHASGKVECGQVILNIGDAGAMPGLAYSDWRPHYYLIPDEIYLANDGYHNMRLHFERNAVPWDQRSKVAFWRGGNAGHSEDGSWTGLPRVQLCRLSKRFPHLFDVGISHTADDGMADLLRADGLMRDVVPPTEFNRYRYQIDIDGNSNAWSALFIKLLTGSPVLKVQSNRGFRQWYYDRLVPWVNFVPVSADMADLEKKVRWLIDHDHEAQEIGERGQQLAQSMEYQSELEAAFPMITCAIREAGLTEASLAVAVTDKIYAKEVSDIRNLEMLQLRTYHGTVIFADTSLGELRHGRISSCPSNVFLAAFGGIGRLLHVTPDGSHYAIRIEAQYTRAPEMVASLADSVDPIEFHIVPTAGSVFGLARDTLYLCAEANGSVTLSRYKMGPWETFEKLLS